MDTMDLLASSWLVTVLKVVVMFQTIVSVMMAGLMTNVMYQFAGIVVQDYLLYSKHEIAKISACLIYFL